MDWDGEPTPFVDADRQILFCLGGFPPDRNGSDWEGDVSKPAAEAMKGSAVQIYTVPRWQRKRAAGERIPRRGGHAAKSVGASMGGGQVKPQNLSHSPRLLAIFAALFALKCFERISGWTNTLFMAFAPDLWKFYRDTLDAVCSHDPTILRNFSQKFSVFSTTTFNFGPRTVTFPHIDFRNLAWGWCAITALGDYDPDRGGHLILWDLKLIIRFPPGSTILIPSAIMRHSNTNIQPHETRFSFTQFTPAALFRWVYNNFRTDKDINASTKTSAAEHEQRRQDKRRRWSEGIKMYRTWKGKVRTL
ncbi:hypothetical protein R3P38DRAFT_3321111 [Favolaschia claudopus]|uniref:Uncharacterized protein n=1 Tax=Favolaschia claudopus TaxID=2862362 RepID=A0AAW0AS49_9AGAR